jgi:hypothetical protein
MRARFVGDPRYDGDGPERLIAFGLDFVKGEWRDVPDDVAGLLSGHTHFEMDDGIPAGAEPIDDWRSLSKEALDAFAAGQGIKLDRRKSLTKMKADYEAALGG